ncbi:MAG TPA: hypothetical protein VIW68_12655 [Candidatus Sulfotelmatobacter sp.]
MATAANPAAAAGGSGDDLYNSSNSDLDVLNGLADEVLTDNEPDKSADGADDHAAATADGGDKGAAAVADGGEQPVWEPLETAPEEVKGLLASNSVSAAAKEWIKKTYEELSGFKEGLTGDPEVSAELADLFPGGMDDIRSAHQNSESFRREMAQYESADPMQHTELLSGLLQQNADAFVSLVPAGLDLLKQTLRDDWTQVASNLTHEYLDTITDGKFGGFFDALTDLATNYYKLADANPDEAAKFAAKLGGSALQMADWWAGAKPKLGYDKATAERGTAGATGRQITGRPTEINEGETRVALREAALFEQQLGMNHDRAINPMISKEVAGAIKARGMNLPQNWQNKVTAAVAKSIVNNLKADRAFQAKLTREYHRGDAKKPTSWDRSDRVAASLVNAAKARAQKLIPVLVKRALDNLSTLGGGKAATAAAAAPGAGVRSGARSATATSGPITDDDLRNSSLSDGELLSRITGVSK